MDHSLDEFLYEGLESLDGDFVQLEIVPITFQKFELVFYVALDYFIDQNVIGKAELQKL